MLYRIGSGLRMNAHVTVSPRRGHVDAVFVDPEVEGSKAITGTFRAEITTEDVHPELANSPHSALSGQRIRDFVADTLPEYMVPAVVTVLDSFPLTPVGKLDHAALPVPRYLSDRPYRAPVGERETLVSALFARVLGVSRVGMDDEFFDLGGDSLSAARLIGHLWTEYGVEITVRQVFDSSTPAGVADLLDRQ